MVKIKKYANVIEKFLQSQNGQRFFNIAYSVGAAIVIWGALFKILHLPGGNALLCVGMGTEIFMFILTAFDRPPKEVDWDEVLPTLGSKTEQQEGTQMVLAAGNAGLPASQLEIGDFDRFSDSSERFISSFESVSDRMNELNRHLSAINSIYELQLRDISSQLQNMDKVSRQIEELRDIYEKSTAESHRYSIEAQRMAENMSQLNAVYERMLQAMNPPTERR